ncbi:hypothetical protein HDU93_004793, partial [Gonapodya sp. JEL0774]
MKISKNFPYGYRDLEMYNGYVVLASEPLLLRMAPTAQNSDHRAEPLHTKPLLLAALQAKGYILEPHKL